MPKQYEAIRDKFMGQGMGSKEAKTRAAKIFNAQRGSKPPVTRAHGRSSRPNNPTSRLNGGVGSRVYPNHRSESSHTGFQED